MTDDTLPEYVEKRVRYFDGQFLQKEDFIDEQNYLRDREYRIERLLHGAGVAEGLTVTGPAANQVLIAPGTAIDGNGYQLVLASAETLDLPGGRFNGKQGVKLYVSYRAEPSDQAQDGIRDYTRWRERPKLTAVLPGEADEGTSPAVLLATLGLDDKGLVTIDETVRGYAGVRLPGSAADAATMRATHSGRVRLDGSLTVTGHAGDGRQLDVVVSRNLGTESGAGGLWVSTDRIVGGHDGVKIGFWNGNNWRLSVLPDGNVGIGTKHPKARLEVGGEDGQGADLVVGGKVGIGTHDLASRLTVSGDDNHLLLRRDETTAKHPAIFLELHQHWTPDNTHVHPCIRFHHLGVFSHRIEGQKSGLWFKHGDSDRDDLCNIFARDAKFTTLQLGEFNLNAEELGELKLLIKKKLRSDRETPEGTR